MYINRNERLTGAPDRPAKGSRSNPRASVDKGLSDTFASMIDVDVVELGDENPKKRKNARQDGLEDEQSEEQPSVEAAAGAGETPPPADAGTSPRLLGALDIKV